MYTLLILGAAYPRDLAKRVDDALRAEGVILTFDPPSDELGRPCTLELGPNPRWDAIAPEIRASRRTRIGIVPQKDFSMKVDARLEDTAAAMIYATAVAFVAEGTLQDRQRKFKARIPNLGDALDAVLAATWAIPQPYPLPKEVFQPRAPRAPTPPPEPVPATLERALLLTHPTGRTWEARVAGVSVTIRVNGKESETQTFPAERFRDDWLRRAWLDQLELNYHPPTPRVRVYADELTAAIDAFVGPPIPAIASLLNTVRSDGFDDKYEAAFDKRTLHKLLGPLARTPLCRDALLRGLVGGLRGRPRIVSPLAFDIALFTDSPLLLDLARLMLRVEWANHEIDAFLGVSYPPPLPIAQLDLDIVARTHLAAHGADLDGQISWVPLQAHVARLRAIAISLNSPPAWLQKADEIEDRLRT